MGRLASITMGVQPTLIWALIEKLVFETTPKNQKAAQKEKF